MTPSATVTQICDQRSCPAPAQRTLLIYGQDFHFCDHHSATVECALMASGTVRWMIITEHRAEPRPPLPRRTTPALTPQRTPQER
jgi:hypothetical protein